MTEDLKIKLSSELDSKGLDDLRKKLNESRNEINALARATDKGTKEYKTYKESVKELNRLIKSSDADLKKYTQSIIDEDKALKKTEKSLKDVGDATEKASGKFDNLIKVGVAAGVTYLASQLGSLLSSLGEMAQEGAAFENLYSAFAKLNGGIDGANQKLELLRNASPELDDKGLIEYTNKMNALGLTTDDTAKLLDIADTKGKDLGVTFDKSSSGLERFIISGEKSGLDDLGVNFVEVREKMEELTGKTYKQIQAFEDSDLQKLRSIAVIDLYGQSTDTINGKIKTTGDKLHSVERLASNVSTLFGVTLANAFETAAGETDLFNDNIATTIQDAQKLGKQIGEAYNKFQDFNKTLQDVSKYLSPVTTLVHGLYSNLKLLTDKALEYLGVVKKLKFEQAAINDLAKQFTDISNFGKTFDVPDDPEAKAQRELLKRLQEAEKTTGTSTKGSTAKEVKETTNKIQDLENEIIKLQGLLNITDPTSELFKNYTFQIEDLRAEIIKLASAYDLLSEKTPDLAILSLVVQGLLEQVDLEGLIDALNELDPSNVFGGKGRPLETGTQKAKAEKGFEIDPIIAGFTTIGNELIKTVGLFRSGVSQGMQDFLDGLATAISLIQTIQTVSSILSFLIPGKASGGAIMGNSPYIVGERGPEIIIPDSSGYVMNNGESQKYLNQSITSNASPVNIYIDSNIDALKFFRNEFPKYENFKRGGRISI